MASIPRNPFGAHSPRQGRLTRLLIAAADARRERAIVAAHDRGEGGPDFGCGGDRDHAWRLVEDLLNGPMPTRVDVGDFLSHAVSLHVRASEHIDEIRSSIQRLRMSSLRARAMAAVVTEIVHFVDTCVPLHDCAALRIALERDDDRLLLAIAAQGDYRLVGSESGTAALLRAMELVEAMRGCFGRGASIDGMVFGVVLPTSRPPGAVSPTVPMMP